MGQIKKNNKKKTLSLQALDAWKAYNSSNEHAVEVIDRLSGKLQTPPNVHSTEIDTLGKELAQYKVRLLQQTLWQIIFFLIINSKGRVKLAEFLLGEKKIRFFFLSEFCNKNLMKKKKKMQFLRYRSSVA